MEKTVTAPSATTEPAKTSAGAAPQNPPANTQQPPPPAATSTDSNVQKATDSNTPEAKAAAEKAAADAQKSADDKAKSETTTQNYEFKNAENLDKEVLGEFTNIAREAGLKGEVAQKIVDLAPKLIERVTQAQNEAFQEQRNEWVKEVQADKDVGGPKFKESQELVFRGVNFLDAKVPGWKQFLDTTGWGDHPLFFKVQRVIGQALGEDKTINGTGENKSLTDAQLFYPSMRKKE